MRPFLPCPQPSPPPASYPRLPHAPCSALAHQGGPLKLLCPYFTHSRRRTLSAPVVKAGGPLPPSPPRPQPASPRGPRAGGRALFPLCASETLTGDPSPFPRGRVAPSGHPASRPRGRALRTATPPQPRPLTRTAGSEGGFKSEPGSRGGRRGARRDL